MFHVIAVVKNQNCRAALKYFQFIDVVNAQLFQNSSRDIHFGFLRSGIVESYLLDSQNRITKDTSRIKCV